MRIEGRTRTGTSKIIFQVCREAKVNRERGGCQVDEGRPWKWEEEEPKLSLCRRHWPLQFLSSGRRRTVCAKTATNSELTNVSVKPLGDSLTLCPIIRAPPQKKKTTTQKLRWTFGAAIFNKNGGFFSKRWPCWTWRNIIWYKWMMTAPFVGPKAVSRRLTISLDDDDYRELPFFSRTQLALASFSRKLLHYMTASYLLYTTKTYVRQGKKIQCARERENHTQVYLRYLRGRPYGGRWPPSTRGDIRQMVFMTSRS